VLTEEPEAPPPNPQIPPQFQPPPPQPDYRALQQLLGDAYQVQPVDGVGGAIPDTIDVLIVAKPGPLNDEQRFAVDQYLMRGGRIIALAAPHKIAVDRSGLSLQKMDPGFNELLSTWGVKVGSELLLDEQNAPFPRPVQERRGGFVMQRIELTPYPFFPDVRQDGFERGHPAVAGLVNLTFPWGVPLEVLATEGVESTVVARTSPAAWTYAGTDLEPPAPGAERKSYPVVIASQGTFKSWFAGKKDPTLGAEGAGRVIEKSLPDARLAVVGSAEMVSDILLQLASSPGGEVHRGNLQLIQNLVDWATQDTDLLEIRSAGSFARTLDPMDDDERRLWEYGQYAVALLLLLGIAGWSRARRAAIQPLSTAGIVEAA